MAEPTSTVSDRQGPEDRAATGAGATATPAAPGGADRDADAGLVLHQVAKTLGGRLIVDNLDLRVRRGELVCLLGPSGCGKTTTLRMIGGFLRPDAGQVLIGGRGYTTTPPERRPTAMVFQNYALWPHMNVFKNVAFGLRLRKLPKAEIAERVERTLALVNLTHHIRSFPAQISGGEQQRVALARALVLEPEVLLLDEPLSNLDAKLRVKVREDIKEIQQRVGITTVFVTHDQDEALSISDRIAVMNAGRIEQYAGAHDLYRMPRTRFVADFVGTMNFFDARVREAPADGSGGAPGGGGRVAVRVRWSRSATSWCPATRRPPSPSGPPWWGSARRTCGSGTPEASRRGWSGRCPAATSPSSCSTWVRSRCAPSSARTHPSARRPCR